LYEGGIIAILKQRSFSFVRYNLLPFTDTNSVICKIIVGRGLAPAATNTAPTAGVNPRPTM